MITIHIVQPEEAGLQVRGILRSVMEISYSAMKSAKWGGRILVNGEPARVDLKVRAGDIVSVEWRTREPAYHLDPYRIKLDIVYEDEYLLIINKPAPLASQSSTGHPDDSLENAVFAHLGCPDGFIYRPVNRLDKGTSGLMTVALDPFTQHRLQQALHTPDFRRSYLAVTEGIPKQDQGVLDFPIAKVPEATIRRCVSPDGKPSVTRYAVLKRAGCRSLLQLDLETGRTHQIRVHLSHIGCPVCGDFLYGTELEELPGRFALHSAFISLTHPVTGEKLAYTSPLPSELAALLSVFPSEPGNPLPKEARV